jgi:hypothetical protein
MKSTIQFIPIENPANHRIPAEKVAIVWRLPAIAPGSASNRKFSAHETAGLGIRIGQIIPAQPDHVSGCMSDSIPSQDEEGRRVSCADIFKSAEKVQ